MVGIHVVCEWQKTRCDFFHWDLPLLASRPSPRSFLLTSWAPSMWDHCCCCFCQVTVMLRCLELCSACFSCLYEPSLRWLHSDCRHVYSFQVLLNRAGCSTCPRLPRRSLCWDSFIRRPTYLMLIFWFPWGPLLRLHGSSSLPLHREAVGILFTTRRERLSWY